MRSLQNNSPKLLLISFFALVVPPANVRRVNILVSFRILIASCHDESDSRIRKISAKGVRSHNRNAGAPSSSSLQ
uniref:Putative secreted protein n=1 Tax=Anopheles darlingi TaxID=43151 RepID=A0A2M4DG79_ANODA